MSDFIPSAPTQTRLDSHVVARAVGAEDIKGLIYNVDHLLGYATQPIVNITLPAHTVSPASISFIWTRNPGVDALAIAVEPWVATVGARFTASLAISAGSIAFIYPLEPTIASPLNGAVGAFSPPVDVLGQAQVLAETIDVSLLTVGTTYTFTLTITTTAGSPQGLRRISVAEVPIGNTGVLAAPSTEIGVAAGWAYSGHSIDSDTLTSATGFARLEREIERARISNKRQWNLAWWENTTGAISRTNVNFGTFTYPTLTASPNFKMRVKRYFETSVPSPHEAAWRYWVTGGGTASLRLKIDGNVVQTWTGLVSAVPALTSFSNFDIPCSTTNQYVRWSLEGKSTSGTVYVSLVYGREHFV